jgi:hypothetical protein
MAIMMSGAACKSVGHQRGQVDVPEASTPHLIIKDEPRAPLDFVTSGGVPPDEVDGHSDARQG